MSELTEHDVFEKARNDSLTLVEAAITFLRRKRDERLSSAEIDPARLAAIAEAASKTGFSKTTGDFPIPLFQTVEFVELPLQPFTLRLNEVERATYTKPRMADPISNETSWWDESIKERVAFIVLDDVIRAAAFDQTAVTSPQDYWNRIRDRAAVITKAGTEPILLVESEFNPRWLYDWRAGRVDAKSPPRPDDLQISRQAGEAPAYLFHMNNIAVYRAPVAEKVCYLMPTSLFGRLQFTRFASGLPVDVQWLNNTNDEVRGTLAATFARQVSISEGRILKVRYG